MATVVAIDGIELIEYALADMGFGTCVRCLDCKAELYDSHYDEHGYRRVMPLPWKPFAQLAQHRYSCPMRKAVSN